MCVCVLWLCVLWLCARVRECACVVVCVCVRVCECACAEVMSCVTCFFVVVAQNASSLHPASTLSSFYGRKQQNISTNINNTRTI